MSVIVKLLDNKSSFKVEILDGENILGEYKIYINEEGKINYGFLKSNVSDSEIPRTLITKAVEELQNISDRGNREIIHEEYLINPDSILKLLPIYSEFGYKKIFDSEDDSCVVMRMEYVPNKSLD